ncbi:substrate-binding domain-containing protein [Streptomyces sp. NPDC059819]|uniref:substrate-binding domain-containing protein n=1 Tax=Streptomyces sp. NPDC059819 TaxID=3346963 RepID=UPI00366437F2
MSSVDKSALLKDLADNDYKARSIHGQCVRVAVNGVDSGIAMQALARGWDTKVDGPRPDVWSPASHLWLQIAHQRATGKDSLNLLPQKAVASIVTSPLTITMPKPTARKLGWPRKKISWKNLSDLAQKPGFKLGKTNPEYSTSGLDATIAAFYAQTGTTGEMAPENLTDPAYQQKVRAIENAAVHYGDTSLTFLSNLRRNDDAGQATSYISAVTVEENSVVAYNEDYPCGSRSDSPGCAKRTTPPSTKLAAFYPTNDSNSGTIYSDHPYIPLNGLTDAQEAVAADFQNFLSTPTAQARFADLGFRTPTHGLTPNITAAHGALPDVSLPGTLDAPPAHVLDQLLTVWRQLRKPANVLLLMDTSG